ALLVQWARLCAAFVCCTVRRVETPIQSCAECKIRRRHLNLKWRIQLNSGWFRLISPPNEMQETNLGLHTRRVLPASPFDDESRHHLPPSTR
ncbi:hypothetical protein DFH06DRAFT_1224464, partial [Mycena polygramma]